VVSQPDQCLTLIGRETTVVDEVRAVLFGLEGFEILDAVETSGGELVVRVETIDPVLGCPACGTRAGRSRGRPWVRLRDVSSAGRRVQVWWRKRRHECPDSDCDRRSFTEQHPAVGARRRSTLRCRVWIAGQVGPQGRAVTAVTGEVGVSWPTGMRAVHEAADLLMITTRSRPTRHLGVDETAFRRRHRWVTNIADLESAAELDVFEGRSAASLGAWLSDQPAWWRDAVEVVAMDACAPFRAAVRDWLPNATIVLDKFHALRLFHQTVDEIRRRTAWRIHQRRGRKIDHVWRARHLLLKAHERLTPSQQERLFSALGGPEDPDGEIGYAYLAKEEARACWAAPSIGRWGNLLALLADSGIAELVRLGHTLDRWHDPIIASFKLGITNACTEGLNRKVKHVKRISVNRPLRIVAVGFR